MPYVRYTTGVWKYNRTHKQLGASLWSGRQTSTRQARRWLPASKIAPAQEVTLIYLKRKIAAWLDSPWIQVCT